MTTRNKIPGRAKYGNKKVEIDGISFDSLKEAKRYSDLKLLIKAGIIKDLRLQPVYEIKVNGVKVCKYISDFEYKEKGKLIIEDVKSAHTRTLPVYRLKKRLLKAVMGIDITEV